MKKVLSLILCLALCLTLMVGCIPSAGNDEPAQSTEPTGTDETAAPAVNATGYPITDDITTYEIAAKSRHNKDFEELIFFDDLQALTNIDIEWIMSSEDGWSERKSLLFTGEDLPDAFYGQGILTDVEVIRYASQGLLIPLNDLIEQYAPNIQHLFEYNPEYKKLLTAPDGNIYALPSITELSPTTHDKLFINKTWLDALDLEVPETTEDFAEVMMAFKTMDPNGNGEEDEIPFSFLPDRKENGLHSMFGSFGQVDALDHLAVKDGQVIYTAQTEEYKAAIEYFNSLYSDGLIDLEAFTHDFNVYMAKVRGEELTVGAFVGWSLSSAATVNKDHYVALEPLIGPDGDQLWKTYTSTINAKGSFVITSSCENPEALMRWADYHYDPEISLQIDQGLFGTLLEKGDDGQITYLPVPEGQSFADVNHSIGPGVNGIGAVTDEITANLVLNENLTERAELDAFYAPFNVPTDEVFPPVYFTEEEVEQLAILQTDITPYVDQQYAKWIVEGGIEEDWEDYLEQLEVIGVQEYIDIHQAAYDRYINS